VLTVVIYNLGNKIISVMTGREIWQWLKAQEIINQSIFIVIITWISLLILPVIFFYILAGRFMGTNQK